MHGGGSTQGGEGGAGGQFRLTLALSDAMTFEGPALSCSNAHPMFLLKWTLYIVLRFYLDSSLQSTEGYPMYAAFTVVYVGLTLRIVSGGPADIRRGDCKCTQVKPLSLFVLAPCPGCLQSFATHCDRTCACLHCQPCTYPACPIISAFSCPQGLASTLHFFPSILHVIPHFTWFARLVLARD